MYTPDDSLQRALLEYVLQSVFSGMEEEKEPESDEEALAQAELLNDRRVLLAGFLKLAIYGVIDMKHAAPVFSQYVKVKSATAFQAHLITGFFPQQFHNFGDLIKMAVTKCREANQMSWYKTVVLSMQQVFEQMVEEQHGTQGSEWASLRV